MPHKYIHKEKSKLAWLAGIIDGEGSIIIGKPVNGRHICRITITNTDLGILDYSKELLNDFGIFHTDRVKPRTESRYKECTTIEVNRKLEAKRLLTYILPYIHSLSKREKAVEAINLIDSIALRKDNTRNNLRRQHYERKLVLKE